jgi:cysteine synthase
MITKAATDAIERVRADYVPAAFEGSDATVQVGDETAFTLTAELVSLPGALGLIVALAAVIALMAHNVSKAEARRDSSSWAGSQEVTLRE